MKKTIKFIICLLFTLTITACAQLGKHAETIKPTARLVGAHLSNVNFDQADLVFDLEVENKNPIPLKLAGLDYDFKVENHSLVSGVTSQAIDIKANAISPVKLPVTVKFDDLKNLPGALWSKDKLAYDLQTTFNIKIPYLGNYAVPVAKKGELPVPKVPAIKLKDIKVKNLSFTTAELLAQVEIDNPNDFDIGLRDLNYQLSVNRKQWGEGSIAESSNIPKKGKGIVSIPLKLNMLSMGTAALAILQEKAPIEYQLTGDATLATGLKLLKDVNLPIDIKGTTALK